MHSGSLEKVGTPRRRTLSRGMSEDESLRQLIKEAEGSAKRLTRADSKVGSLKKPHPGENQAEEDLITNFPEMLDLQESYDEVVQELRGLELERETLVFQVDCLQDALEGAEEMLAEARREADNANEELERERQGKKRLEEAASSLREMVAALTEEIQRLKEERVAIPTVPVYAIVTDSRLEGEGHAAVEEEEDKREGTREEGDKGDGRCEEEPEMAMDALEEASEWVDAPDAPLSIIRLDSTPSPLPRGPMVEEAETTAGGILAAFFRKGKEEQSVEGGHPALHSARLGSSVDSEDDHVTGEGEGPLSKIQRIFNKTFGQTQDGALYHEGGVSMGAESLPGLGDAIARETPMATPEEAPLTAADAPDTGSAPPRQEVPDEDRQLSESEGEDGGTRDSPFAHLPEDLPDRKDGLDPISPKSPDSCVVS
ncbi:hypothetical protein SKAU_G00150790 [Synaphobranchus kaupii]|uniref:Leucine-rich repeat flightless-interacting protein 1-like n=1 Tax=Synaphobranchus kaupii TaxID=118154 RepID=A0A9Q1FGX4_SYNKA|nr:hypothetical protein SKAU_G00150790 [Synaphobranchus kaupii]